MIISLAKMLAHTVHKSNPASGLGPSGHFDESPFSVTLMLQPSLVGGDFDVIADSRGSGPANLAPGISAEAVHAGACPSEKLDFEVGTLSVFGGRRSLHRVRPIAGDTLRLVAVLCFSESPGQMNTPETSERFWGRVASAPRG